ncbi:hypothetical protein U271_01860 [Staphylococcus aureus F70893]|uniref:hypothetical protein n=1 Tax=Staphylococcus TaxID=1279 RepID=UPI00045221EA|nr:MULTISPECIES: hypothetical protein [Staphylococcus]EVX44298.1 hypothetical protein U271_01860 [Staphylococcus aureus F70893]EVX62704.1 hypothetical protein U280_02510 [Staphylococcus aureus F77047]EWW99076.1 hypothetical protein V308_01997 [Staphylococcus aureus H81433]MBG1130554.1 hypothetical protein [Staphylococcus aureus]MDI1662460.1 hypothetical protein [Staphylococcus aureus]
MDNHKDAIKLINDLKIEVISADNHDLVSGESEIPNNPLHNVLYEILFTELVIPILQKVEHQLGENSVSFDLFYVSENKKEINLVFNNPRTTIGSFMNLEESVEVIIKNYVQESEEEKDLHSLLCKSK